MRVGHAIYKECVYKHEWFCEPAAELLDGGTPATRPRHVRDTSRRCTCTGCTTCPRHVHDTSETCPVQVAELLESWAGYREWRMEEFPESPVAPFAPRARVLEAAAGREEGCGAPL